VEVHWSETAEAYVTPVSEDEVGVAVLWHGVRPSRGDWLASFPRLGRELRGAEIISTLRGAGPLRQSARRVTRGPAALVGDAAGYVDALTGEGIALGFRTARAAVAAIASGELHPYERAYAKASRRYRAVTELALSLASSPRARRHSIRALARRPALFERMLGWMS
jgi:flavin-dependent dehydrogenase